MEESKSNILIECVAKENYDNFCRVFWETLNLHKNKELIIFGAGILGMQFGITLKSIGATSFKFCDNCSLKWGKKIGDSLILSPQEIDGKSTKYFVFLAMEDYYSCAVQLENMGYKNDQEWCNLTNYSEAKLMEDFEKDFDAETLILGDCTAVNIAITDKQKESIATMLYQKDKVKLLATNGMYMRWYYNMFLMSLLNMQKINKVIILLGLDIFNDKFHLLTKNQHEKLYVDLLSKTSGSMEEFLGFQETLALREKKNNAFYNASPKREDNVTDYEIEQGRKMHMKLNYLYELKEDNESINYLDHMLKECEKRKIENIWVIMPVNYEMGEKYFGNDFYVKYQAIKMQIEKHIKEGKGKVLDLSYLLSGSDFICLRSTNEGIRDTGRKKIVELLLKEI